MSILNISGVSIRASKKEKKWFRNTWMLAGIRSENDKKKPWNRSIFNAIYPHANNDGY